MARIDINVTGEGQLKNLREELTKAKNEAAELNTKLKGAMDSKETTKLKNEIDRLTKAEKALNDQIKKLEQGVNKGTKALEKQRKQLGYIQQLKKDINTSQKTLNKADKAWLTSSDGKKKIKELKAMNKELDQYKRSTGEIAQKESGGGGRAKRFGFSPGGIGANVLTASLFLGAGYKAMQLGREAIQTVKDYEQANANLNSVLGTTAEQTKDLQEQQQELGGSTAFTATEVANLQLELGKLGFEQQEIIDSTQGIINFAIATGTDVPRAAAVAGAALRAFNLDAKEMDRVVSALGVATTKSSLDFSKLEAGLPIVGGVAQQFGATIEETTAQLGVLSDRGITAATAATALRNIYLKSAAAGMTFDQALEQLAGSQTKVNDALDLFGVRGALQAVILAENREETDKLTKSITDVNEELQIMADKRMNTITGQTTLLTSAWQKLILALDKGDGIMGRMAKQTLKDLTAEISNFAAVVDGIVPWYTVFADQSAATLWRTQAEGQIKFAKDLNKEIEKIYTGPLSAKGALGRASLNVLGFGSPDQGTGSKEMSELQKLQAEINAEEERRKKAAEAAAKAKGKRHKEEKQWNVESIEWLKQQITDTEALIATLDPGEGENRSVITEWTQQLASFRNQLGFAEEEINDLKEKAEWELATMQDMLMTRAQGALAPLAYSRAMPGSIPMGKEGLKEQAKEKKEFDKWLEEQKKRNQKIIDLNKKRLEKEKEDELKMRKEINKEIITALAETAQSINETLFKIAENRSDRVLRTDLHNLDREYDARIDMAEDNAQAREQLEEELRNRREQLERKHFEESKKRQIAEAIISGAMAAVQSLAKTTLPFPASLIAPGVIAAKTAAEIAIITNQSYAEGGFTSGDGMADPNHPGRRVVGVVHDNEYVVRKEEIAAFPDEIRRIEQRRVRGFADGGFTSPIDFDYMSQQASTISNISMDEIYNVMYKATKEGSEDGTKKGSAQGERQRELRDLREYRANRNIKQ